jgi:hypothetical protein
MTAAAAVEAKDEVLQRKRELDATCSPPRAR